jgi:hypothetical protein
MKRPESLTVVHVTWVDSDADNSWRKRSKLADGLESTHSVGFLLKQNTKLVTLALSFDPETDSANNIMYIPRGAILEMREVCQVSLRTTT